MYINTTHNQYNFPSVLLKLVILAFFCEFADVKKIAVMKMMSSFLFCVMSEISLLKIKVTVGSLIHYFYEIWYVEFI
jgi:hypothetical protein